MYRVSYRVGGRLEAVLIVEDQELNQVLEQASNNLNSECEVRAEPIGREEAGVIPTELVGHLLDEDEAADLNRIMVAQIPRKPPAPPSVRRPLARRRV